MTKSQRKAYMLMLQAGREDEATAYRDQVNAAIARAEANTSYVDKHGHKIKPGMMIQIDGAEPEEVLLCGEDDLGVNASNPVYLAAHPTAPEECYSLSNFSSADIEIIGYPIM